MGVCRTFINKVFSFMGIGLALYIIANVYTCVSRDAIIKNTIKCKFCRKRISEKVRGRRLRSSWALLVLTKILVYRHSVA